MAVERLTEGNGRLSLGGEEKFIVVPLRAYGALYDAARRLLGGYSAGLLYYVGLEMGRGLEEELVRSLNGDRSDPRCMLTEFARLLEELGFGKAELVELRDGEALVRMHENATTEVIRGVGQPVCHIERGMIAGAFEAVTGRRVIVKEVRCRAKGDPYCEFHIKFV